VDFSHLFMQTKVSSISLQDNIKLLVTNYVKLFKIELLVFHEKQFDKSVLEKRLLEMLCTT
jgi:hypothetical protein